jgi:hypothetical protein
VPEHERLHGEDHAAPGTSRASTRAAAPAPLMQLQRLAGNAAVSSLVAQRQEEKVPTQTGGGGGGGGSVGPLMTLVSMSKPSIINVKLQNGSVVDASFNTS